MKRSIALILVLLLALSGCAGRNKTPETTENTENTKDSSTQTTAPLLSGDGAVQVLEKVWARYGEEERFFASGGHPESAVDNAPGSYDITDTESLTFGLLVPEGQLPYLKEAASLVHAMNSNILSAAAFRLTKEANSEAFAKAMRDAIQGNQWICGFPETLLIADMGRGNLLISFGVNDAMDPFQSNLTEAYGDAQILYKEAITG